MTDETAKPKKSGCLKYLAIGCGGILLLAAIGGFLAYRGIKGFISRMTEEYTDTAPLVLPSVEVSEEEAQAVLNRVADFTEALQQDRPAAALALTSRDINVLIHRHPDWTNMAGKVHVTIEGDRLQGQTSIPLDELGGIFKGRYLNGAATFRVDMTAGRLLVFLDSVEVGGKMLPEQIMSALRAKNLAEDANQDTETASILLKLDSITVQDGSLSIVPKSQ